MAELKYTYALDKNENCIGIGNAQKGIEYRCPHCKGEMVVKEGSIKVKHYAHKIRPQNCSYETYLHALAKKRIEEWFNSDSALNISFRTKDRCSNFEHCLWNHDDYTSYCEKKSSRSFNLKNYYNVITREKTYKGFRADLLLSDSEKGQYFVKFNVDGLLRGDYASRMQGYATARQNGWMSANDIRELEDMNMISEEEGGNLYLVNGSFTKLADAGAFANPKKEEKTK